MNYLYVIHIPVYGADGRLYMERTAALDLQAHQRLLPNHIMLTLAAPFTELDSGQPLSASLEEITGVEYVPLRFVDSVTDGLKSFRYNRRQLAQAVASAELVHTGCGGFPFFFSPCYLAYRLALKMRKKLLFVMDCDLVGKLEMDQVRRTRNPLKKTIWYLFSRLCLQMYRNCLSHASTTFLLGRGVVSRYGRYATNMLEIYQPVVGPEMIIPSAELQEKITDIQKGRAVNICFAGRLAPEKGVEVMLRALAMIKDRFQLSINIYGDGPCRGDYMQLADSLGLAGVLNFHGNMEWGSELFTQLRKNHILVVPHLTLEMTRNVFDGMASGCAIIASDTKALSNLVSEADSGVVFRTGDPEQLARVLARHLRNPDRLGHLMMKGINFVRDNNRDSHVRRRLDFLAGTLALPL